MGYKVIRVDGIWRAAIDKKGEANKYGEPKIFKSAEEAQKWIDKCTYSGMSHNYEIKEV